MKLSMDTAASLPNLDIKLHENNNLKIDVTLEIEMKYGDFYKLYTDGSKCRNVVGAAFYDPVLKHHKTFKINNNYLTILTAELIGIFSALQYVEEIEAKRVVILTDSKSALQHILKCTGGNQGISIAFSILKIMQLYKDNGLVVKMQWIPSHIGLIGNEEVDKFAKMACTDGITLNVKPHYSELLPKFKIICYDIWKEFFDKRSLDKEIWYRTFQTEPPHIPWFTNAALNRNILF